MANTYLTRTFGSAGNRKKWTFSAWVKKAVNGVEQRLLTTSDNATFDDQIKFKGADKLEIVCNSGSGVLTTNRLFRDNSAWYHIVAIWDSGNSTSGDRCQLWVNGIRETSFATETYPSINQDGFINNNTPHYIGVTNVTANSHHFNGIMSHIHFIDGTAYDPTAFGEFDANGVWKIKTSPSVTYGTNGFFILKNGNSVTDQSGNSNNFTVAGGTLTNTEDSPSNVFATFNPLKASFEDGAIRDATYSEGNLVALHHETGHKCPAFSTIASNSGKFYAEVKWLAVNGSYPVNQYIGIVNIDAPVIKSWNTLGYFYRGDGTKMVVNTGSAYGDTYTTGDIIGIAMDLDNSKLYFSKNGVWQNSGDPTSGASGTGAISIASNINYAFMTEDYNNGKTAANFGNGYFGTTAVASAGTNASGIGIFEYDVPTGFTALSTKGLNL